MRYVRKLTECWCRRRRFLFKLIDGRVVSHCRGRGHLVCHRRGRWQTLFSRGDHLYVMVVVINVKSIVDVIIVVNVS